MRVVHPNGVISSRTVEAPQFNRSKRKARTGTYRSVLHGIFLTLVPLEPLTDARQVWPTVPKKEPSHV